MRGSDFSNFGWNDLWDSSAWRTVRRLQDEVNRLFDEGWTPGARGGFPPVNVWSNEEQAVVTAEVPGVAVQDLDLSVMGSTLTISGERRLEEPKEKERYLRRERGTGKFTRTVELPFIANSDKVEASCSNGVLKVVLLRSEADRPKKVIIGS